MIELQITDEVRRYAWAKSRDMGKLKNSITSGDGNQCGFIGEQLASEYLGGVLTNTYDYDILIPEGFVDCKAKQVSSVPYPHYEVSVAQFNTFQECDYYAFMRVEFLNNVYTRAWFLGIIRKEEYYDKARKLIKGQKDGSNGFTVRADCYNLRIDQLYDSVESANGTLQEKK